MRLKIGQAIIVVISSSIMAKQVLKKQDLAFSTRFIPNVVQTKNYSNFYVVWLPVCPQWRTIRRILNTNIFSYKRLDENQHLRSQKVEELIAYCEKCSQQGEALNVGHVAFKIIINMLSNTLFSKDLVDHLSDSKVELKDAIDGFIHEAGKINLVDFFPILEKIDPPRIRYHGNIYIGKLFKLFDDLINERLEEKKTNHDEKSDVLEALLNHSAQNPKEMDQNHIKSMFLNLIVGGTDTSTITLEWAMAEILRQPEIMKKAQAELAQVVGKGKPIEEVDVSRLPYLQFIVKETLRMHPLSPLLGSRVLVNVWAIGQDSIFWEDPLDFELIPFGAGQRICPDLTLALRMVQVMLGSMLNSFNWKLESGIHEPKDLDMKEKFALMILAKTHPLRAIPSPL
ncbi:hypothetical protein R3W88_025934 [Solanum pinnatisectum]|uniref:Cytochrome P450 n=1 Tax=Solanum pinnatisectum TaxID=50273 RepID=A0AAV9M547_9SOLN|nr:hypothetical protein R3W88_025934 [Solanum pinnatisectum]